MPDATRTAGRRQLLKAVTVGGGAVVVGTSLPAAWTVSYTHLTLPTKA